ncbi:DUF456 domain-containing protein [Micromonospora echinofusca]|uniref:DUF456 family protein n=1 Tax=Micromonospora echinofusca TaxID=47858 RepID=A0ABS3VP44_MICEH|nr:DUF456 domain-containing protein [Micromonospora echinofusca]MBO4206285.1 DUF456 family protein [Micromonospora echinofusca]
MDLTDTQSLVTLLAGVAIVAGLLGVVVPVLPALPLCWGGVLIWAIFTEGGWQRWAVLGAATVVAVLGTVVKYAWPGRNLKRVGVPNSTLLAGGVLGIVGFFVVPVVGLLLGFVLGIWLAERLRLGDNQLAWPATKQAVQAAGLAFLIEFTAGAMIATLWVAGLVLT